MVSTRFVGFLALVLTNQLALGFRARANLQHVSSSGHVYLPPDIRAFLAR